MIICDICGATDDVARDIRIRKLDSVYSPYSHTFHMCTVCDEHVYPYIVNTEKKYKEKCLMDIRSYIKNLKNDKN